MVCGEAETIFDALKAIERLQPDVIVVDISLKGESDVDLIKDIRIRYRQCIRPLEAHSTAQDGHSPVCRHSRWLGRRTGGP